MRYPKYLVHFNGKHDPKNGQFADGDGDNDGIIDDHHNYSRNKNQSYQYQAPQQQKKKITPGNVKFVSKIAGWAAGQALTNKFNKSDLGQWYNSDYRIFRNELVKATDLDRIIAESGGNEVKAEFNQIIDQTKESFYNNAANFINKCRGVS